MSEEATTLSGPPAAPIAPLRPIEIVPISHQGQDLLLLRDPSGVAGEPLIVSRASLELLRYCDGRHTVRDIQLAAARASGRILPSDQVCAFFAKLEEKHFLASPAFDQHREALAREYATWSARPAQFAGTAYSADQAILLRELDALYAGTAGLPTRPLVDWPGGLAVPHIDPSRGAAVYAAGYARLWGARPDGIVILGVSHAGGEQPFILTSKDFATPLGIAPTDRTLIEALAGALSFDPLAEQDLHRWEHSIEFQVVFLQHALSAGARPPSALPPCLPVLCTFSWEDLLAPPPSRRAQIDEFLTMLRAQLAARGGRWLIVAGVDLAHVGKRFGDREPLTSAFLENVARADRASLDQLAAGDGDGFVRDLAEQRNARRVCGLPALYALNALLPGTRGEVLGYEQSVDERLDSAVGFGALALWNRSDRVGPAGSDGA